MTRIKIFNLLLVIALSVLLAGACWFASRVHALVKQQQVVKQDYSLVHSATFGLFSVDMWREKLSAIINAQVNDYQITPEQKEQLRVVVEKELHALVAKTIAEIDKPQKSLSGKIKKMAFHALVDSDALQAQVTPFTNTIVQKISSPASQARLKDIASSKINELLSQTYDATYEANEKVVQSTCQKYHVANLTDFDHAVDSRLNLIWSATIQNSIGMLACVLAALLLWMVMRKKTHLQRTLFVMSLLFAIVLLLVGLTSPIIEVDARIRSVDLMLLSQKVNFENQVLFFQSKSIWGVITTLLQQQKPDAITVGILILLFIVILPFLRLAAKGLHMFVKNSKVINYLAFEANKWDMADVMIIGILMTYIGLNGILKSQLSSLNIHSETLTTRTVNYTALQPGFFIFAGYVIFEFILSYILKKRSPEFAKKRRNKQTRYKKKSALADGGL